MASLDPKQIATAGYHQHGDKYDAWTQSRPEGLEIRLKKLDKLLEYVNSESNELKILELGCGAGDSVTLRLAVNPAVKRVVANDISSTMLRLLRANLAKAGKTAEYKVEIAGGDMTGLEIEAGSLDAVVAFYSNIHLEQSDQRTMISLIADWLKADIGYLLCCFGAQQSAGNMNENWLGMQAYWSSFGAEKSVEVVREAGFEIVLQELVHEFGDAEFLWVIARKNGRTT